MTTPADRIKASDKWPGCLNWPALGCLCRGAMQNGGSFCARKRNQRELQSTEPKKEDGR